MNGVEEGRPESRDSGSDIPSPPELRRQRKFVVDKAKCLGCYLPSIVCTDLKKLVR